MDLLQPRMVQRIVDEGIARGDAVLAAHTGLVMVGLAAIGIAGGAGCTVYAVLAAQGFGTDLRRAVFAQVQALSFGNLDRLGTGALVTRLTSDVAQVQEVVMLLLRILVRVPLMLVGSLIMAVLTSPRLAVLFLALIPVVLAVIVVVVRVTYPMFGEVQRRLDTLNTVLQESLAGVRVVRAFAREGHELRRFGDANERLTAQNIRATRVSAVTMPSMMLLVNAGVVGALWLGGVQTERGDLHVGQVIAFINYLMQTLVSLMMVSMLVLRVSRAEASAQRLLEVLSSVPDVQSPVAPVSRPASAGRARVAFEGVRFAYGGADGDPVLKDITFAVEPGEMVAILGATGAGKSTLVSLAARFYDASAGRVTIGGVDVRDLSDDEMRRAIAVGLQEAILFSGTIRDNIRHGRPDATDEEVERAAAMAQADEFIRELPDGYATELGQRGVNLSGGQRQRIAIARALLTGADVLVLDDCTSAVDVATEARIQEALASLRGTRTCLVVAQRISAVRSADRVLVLEDGRIAAMGRHADLLAASEIYRGIYESQVDTGRRDLGGG